VRLFHLLQKPVIISQIFGSRDHIWWVGLFLGRSPKDLQAWKDGWWVNFSGFLDHEICERRLTVRWTEILTNNSKQFTLTHFTLLTPSLAKTSQSQVTRHATPIQGMPSHRIWMPNWLKFVCILYKGFFLNVVICFNLRVKYLNALFIHPIHIIFTPLYSTLHKFVLQQQQWNCSPPSGPS